MTDLMLATTAPAAAMPPVCPRGMWHEDRTQNASGEQVARLRREATRERLGVR